VTTYCRIFHRSENIGRGSDDLRTVDKAGESEDKVRRSTPVAIALGLIVG
jgi:hypothetical protein